jgi:hypothetical protein
MFNSTVLDVAVGLIFTFLALSLAVSAIVEALASFLNWRSTALLQGVKDLLNDQEFTGLAREIYNHALVNPRDDGKAITEQELKRKPAYIHPEQFADALMDVTKIAGAGSEAINSRIAKIGNDQLRLLMQGIVIRTSGDLDKIRNELARWFDNGMDRLSGVYKRNTQAWSFALALIIAAALNVSAIDIGLVLWQRPILLKAPIPLTYQTVPQAVATIQGLGTMGVPIGWSAVNAAQFLSTRGIWTIVGWLITAFATLFGAPFWFDALQQFVRLKGTGPSPDEKRSGSGAAA